MIFLLSYWNATTIIFEKEDLSLTWESKEKKLKEYLHNALIEKM